MSPEDRRAALIAATVPLLREHGVSVSTRQIAEAAGVAEGTIFNAFPDKLSLLRAALLAALEPQPIDTALDRLLAIPDLRQRLAATVDLLRHRLSAGMPLVHAARTLGGGDPAGLKDFFERLFAARARTISAVVAVFEPDRDKLRRDPASAARLLFMLVMATLHAGPDEPDALSDMDTDDIVALLLDGLLIKPTTTTSTGDPS
jgi:AcrR family transcriptional regulator